LCRACCVCVIAQQEHGVDKIYKLEPGKPLSDCDRYERHLSDHLVYSNVWRVTIKPDRQQLYTVFQKTSDQTILHSFFETRCSLIFAIKAQYRHWYKEWSIQTVLKSSSILQTCQCFCFRHNPSTFES